MLQLGNGAEGFTSLELQRTFDIAKQRQSEVNERLNHSKDAELELGAPREKPLSCF
jgi:hypothetical protein